MNIQKGFKIGLVVCPLLVLLVFYIGGVDKEKKSGQGGAPFPFVAQSGNTVSEKQKKVVVEDSGTYEISATPFGNVKRKIESAQPKNSTNSDTSKPKAVSKPVVEDGYEIVDTPFGPVKRKKQ